MERVEETFSFADYAVFAGMLCISTSIGVFYAWKDRNNSSNKEFLTSNRSLQLFPVAMSLLASFQSSVTILGYPAEMYLRGTQFWLVILSGILAAVIAAEVFLPVYYGLSFTSVNEYLSLRFRSETIRIASSLTFLLGTVPYMGVVLYGPSLALSSVTPLPVSTSILIIGLICTFYTSIGGIKAVVWTDTVQVFLMFAGLLAVMIRGFSLVGGIGNAFSIAQEGGRIEFFNAGIDVYSTNNLWNAIFGMSIMWCGNYCTSQTEVQRYCNVTSQKSAKIALYLNMVGMMALISCACLCGIAVYANYAHCDPLKLGVITQSDQLMPFFVMDTLASGYPGVPGLFVSCVFSASLSTLSSGFNALAAVTWDDFLKHTSLKNMSDSGTKTLSKILAASYGLLAIGMAFLAGQIGSVLKAAISLSGALVGPLFGLYLLGMLCPFANAKGVLIGLLTGEALALWVLIGSLLFPRAPDMKMTYIDQCPADKFGLQSFNTTLPTTIYHETEGIMRIYHVAYLLVPIIGFVVSISVGSVASLLTGGLDEIRLINPKYLSPLASKIWPQSYIPQQMRRETFDLISTISNEKMTTIIASDTLTLNGKEKEHVFSSKNGSYKRNDPDDQGKRSDSDV